jgi:ADP-heptose:LPS heptosyltransferase
MTARVLLLRALGLGDFLTGVPAYRAVRRALPGHRVVLAAPARFAPLAALTGAIDELLPAGELEPVLWPGPPPGIAIDLHGRGPASHRLLAELGPARLIAFGGPHGGGFPGPIWYPGEHEVARWCRLLAESGIPADPADLRLPEPPRAGAGDGPAGPVIIHPGAAAPARRWPAGRFAEVARQLTAGGRAVWVTGSAAEHALAARVARDAGLPPGRVLAGRTGLAGLARLAARAELIISGDTGMSHLAAAFGRPSVTLAGPVPPAEWGPPRHPRHQVLWPAADGYRGNPHGSRTDPVLAAIGVPGVLAAARRALEAGAAPPRAAVSPPAAGTAAWPPAAVPGRSMPAPPAGRRRPPGPGPAPY